MVAGVRCLRPIHSFEADQPEMKSRCLSIPAIIVLLSGCSDRQRERPLFRLLSPNETGVTFANTITTSDTLNVQTDVYVYNLSLIHISEPTRLLSISYAVFC